MSDLSTSSALRSNSEPTFGDSSLLTGEHAKFFAAWKKGVSLAGVELFGSGTRAGCDEAQTKSALIPNVARIRSASVTMSPNEQKFVAAMVSVYDTHDGAKLLKRAGFKGLADLQGLDPQRRAVLAALILHYTAW